MKFAVICMFLCIIMRTYPPCSAAALQSEWRLDYVSGDGVRIDSATKELERYPFQKVSNLRLSPENPLFVWGEVHYTRKNRHPLTLTFQSTLETHKTSHQDDASLKLTILIYRHCAFVGKSYHLPADIISTTPYELIPNSTTYINVNIDEASLIVIAIQQKRYKRPLDSSEYVQSYKITVPIKRTVLRYTYADEQRECYPTHRLTAHHEEYEFLNKELTPTQPIAYTLLKTGQMDPSSIEHITQNLVSVSVTEEWFRPGIKEFIQLSRRIELPIKIEHSAYRHDDANLRSTQCVKSYIEHHSSKLMISETTETIPYQDHITRQGRSVFRSCEEANKLDTPTLYKRPDGSYYRIKPTHPVEVDGFELL